MTETAIALREEYDRQEALYFAATPGTIEFEEAEQNIDAIERVARLVLSGDDYKLYSENY